MDKGKYLFTSVILATMGKKLGCDGVHVSAAGAVSVFCDEDEFFCPNCNSNKSRS
jgi:hypothetical protein